MLSVYANLYRCNHAGQILSFRKLPDGNVVQEL